MKSLEENKVADIKLTKDNDYSTSPDGLNSSLHHGSHIGRFDFITWTIIPFIGILFCLIHSEQSLLWEWVGDTPAEAQSFQAKTIVSIISAIIGGCVAATLLKTVKTVSFTIIKYKGVNFSELATMIGGFSVSNVPMLSVGNGWLSIIVIIMLLILSTITKQLAVVSMTVSPVFASSTASHYTRNYTTCFATNFSGEFSRQFPIFSLETVNSLRNQNVSYTNEYYDRSIPEGIKGIANFQRILPFANASCIKVPTEATFDYRMPTMQAIDPNISSAWSAEMNIVFDHDRKKDADLEYLKCTIFVGHAIANTSCNNTLCQTHRVSEITPYHEGGVGLEEFMGELFTMYHQNSNRINIIQSWLAGGNITTSYTTGDKIPGESVEIIEKNSAILGAIFGRIICDINANKQYDEVTYFNSYLEYRDHYRYHISWKWPFWLLIALIIISWLLCMITMWITPESRIMSVEWLLSQYVTRDKWGYISGRDLALTHKGALFQVVDQQPDDEVGNIVIAKIGIQSDIRNTIILHKKQYQ